MTALRVGFVGLGRMGRPMALNLVKAGHAVVVHNRSRPAVDALVAAGATSAASPAAVMRQVDVLVTCLLSPEQCLDVYLGAEGIASGARPAGAQVCIGCETIDLMTTRRLGAGLEAAGVAYVDAPVSGGPWGAEQGTLTVMCGGDAAALDRVAPVLDVFGRTRFHLGPAGSGVAAKLVNQILTHTQHAAVAEAMVLGAKLGLDPRQLFEVVRTASGQSTALERSMGKFTLARDFTAAYSVEGAIKDLECGIRTAKMAGARLLLPNVAQQMYVEAMGLGHGDKDISAVILPAEAIAGCEVKGA